MRTAFLRTAVSTAALLSAPAAFADVTAEQVWENWKENLALYGEDGVSVGSETVGSGTVSVTDLTLTLDDDESIIVSNLGALEFTENGDGTVTVTMHDSYPITIEEAGDNTLVELVVNQAGLAITVSGEPDAMNYDVAADSYEIALGQITSDEPVEAEAFMRINDVTGSYQTDTNTGMNTTFGFAASSIDFLLDAKEPAEEGYVVFSGQMGSVTSTGEIDLPEGADMDDPETFANDFAFRGETTAESMAVLFDVDIDGDVGNGSVQAGKFVVGGDMNPETLDYVFSLADAAVNMEVPDLPFPFAMSFSLLENTLAMPTGAADEPAAFGYRFALADFSISDEIWAMGDPAGALPRDPATIIFDISGMAKLFFDLFDPEQQEALELADVPGEINSLDVNNIQVTAVGAEVKADGAFTFDNTDLDTFDGFPRPQGELNVGITGANALIDTLIGMGLLPQEQATMGRMMMGMFTQPAGDDALTSKIEINEQGHVLANGQRIQ